MLHNSGPFGHNDTTVNVGMPINGTHLSTMNNINKLAQPHSQSSSHFGTEYPGLIHPFNINNVNFNNYRYPYSPLPSDQRRPILNQNGMMPMNLNIHNTEEYIQNLPEQQKKYMSNQIKEPDIRSMPINIPHYRGFGRYLQDNLNANIESLSTLQYKDCAENQNYINKTTVCETVTSIEQNIQINENQNTQHDTEIKDNSVIEKECVNEKSKDKEINFKFSDLNKPTWTDTDYLNPFEKDVNGCVKENLKGNDHCVISGEDSYNVVRDIIQKDLTEGSGEKLFQCPHCPLLFKHPKRFLIHTKWHTIAKELEERIKPPRERKHREVNPGHTKYTLERGSFPCVDCKKNFITRKSLRNHRGKYHSGLPKECKICHKVMPNYKSLRDHIKVEHTEEKNFKCTYCPKTFKVAHSLQKHQDTHLEKTFECQQCNKKFGSELLLTIHMKGHEKMSKGTTYHCSYCGKGFYHSYNLQVHERTHRNERPFACTICNSTYGTNSGLQRHLKVSHNTNKPWECSICHRSFSTESIRDRHEVRIHGNPEDLKFPCNFCPSRYMSAKDLGKHYNKVHSKGKKRKRKTKQYSDESE